MQRKSAIGFVTDLDHRNLLTAEHQLPHHLTNKLVPKTRSFYVFQQLLKLLWCDGIKIGVRTLLVLSYCPFILSVPLLSAVQKIRWEVVLSRIAVDDVLLDQHFVRASDASYPMLQLPTARFFYFSHRT